MDNRTRIAEIDITRQARALACLRLTDYALVVLCGFSAIGLLSDMVVNVRSGNLPVLLFELIATCILGFGAYSGWRHVGVIDPTVWRAYRIVFPLLVVFCLFVVGSMVATSGSLTNFLDQDRAQATQSILQLSGLMSYVWILATSLLGWISLMLLRRMKITAMGTTVDHVLSGLGKRAGVTAVQAAKIKRINKPRGLVMGAAGAVLLLGWTLAPLPNNPVLAQSMLRMSQQINLLGFFLLLRARRYFQVDAESLLAVDRRPPILFLRSFEDDEKQNYGRSDKALLDFSLETRLGSHFSRFGPFVAIGSPKETVSQLGAARVLLSDDQWQTRVLSWIREASVIIMYSGKTHWVNWELREVLENECATRLILMIPEIKNWRRSKRRAEISARVGQIREVFKSTPWEEELLQFEDFVGLRAMLFRADGSMIMVKSRSRGRDSYHLAALVAHEILLESELAAAQTVPSAAAVASPPAAPRRSRRYVASLAVAAASVFVIVGYKHFRHEPTPESAHALEAVQLAAAPAHNVGDIAPSPPAPESETTDVSTNTNSRVPTEKSAAPVGKAVVQAKVESRQSPNASAFAARSNPVQPAIKQPITTPPEPPDPNVAMLQSARDAMSAGRLVEPRDDCALYWAQQLHRNGNPEGASIEKYVLDTMGRQIDGARVSKNYDLAIDDVNKLMQFYPGRSELMSLKVQIESEQVRQALEARAEAQVQRFFLQHRHLLFTNNGNMVQAYCVGVLVVAPDGSARFDCTMTFDPQGRCDHVEFVPGTIKEIKFLRNGLLHVATHHLGNFDFYGEAANLQGAYQGLRPLQGR